MVVERSRSGVRISLSAFIFPKTEISIANCYIYAANQENRRGSNQHEQNKEYEHEHMRFQHGYL